MSEALRIINALTEGDPHAPDQLLPLVYRELRNLAVSRLAREKPGQTLDATGLVHEAYIRLIGNQPDRAWDGRAHFFGAAAEAMRRILVDRARHKKRIRHGGDLQRVEVGEIPIRVTASHEDILAVHEALDGLAAADNQAAQVVKLHYFAGLSMQETADVLQVSVRTVHRDWAFARAWLHQKLDSTRS
jgi:RNA polymerase sigma factor (TIGR02999 family)